MGLLQRLKGRNGGGDTALAEPPRDARPLSELLDEVEELSATNRESHDVELDRRILRLRHRAGIRLIESPPPRPEHAKPASDGLKVGDGLPEVAPEGLTPQVLRAGMLEGGCLLVRGLISSEDAARLADEIESTFAAREKLRAGGAPEPGYYEEMVPDPPCGLPGASLGGGFRRCRGGRLAADDVRHARDLRAGRDAIA